VRDGYGEETKKDRIEYVQRIMLIHRDEASI
jgi:hypothetical protein